MLNRIGNASMLVRNKNDFSKSGVLTRSYSISLGDFLFVLLVCNRNPQKVINNFWKTIHICLLLHSEKEYGYTRLLTTLSTFFGEFCHF